MSLPATRSAAITAKCRECCHDPAEAGTWRQQSTVCPVTSCPLWAFRPLSGDAPAFLLARDPARLPAGWARISQRDAVAAMKAGADGRFPGIGDISPANPSRQGIPVSDDAPIAPIGNRRGGAS